MASLRERQVVAIFGLWLRCRWRCRSVLGRVAVQRMHGARLIFFFPWLFVVLLRQGFLTGALHQDARTYRRRLVFQMRRGLEGLRRLIGRRTDIGSGLQRMRRRSGTKRIGLADQPRQFGERVVFSARGRTAIMIVVGGKRSVLVSISHREDASPSGQRHIAGTHHWYERNGPCQIPSQIPIREG